MGIERLALGFDPNTAVLRKHAFELSGHHLDALEQAGELEKTFVVFTSDNGFHLGTHRRAHGKADPYDESTRVPLIVRGPGVARGAQVDAPVLNIDLAPTLAELAGVAVPDWVDGGYDNLLESSTPALRRSAGDYPFHEDDMAELFYTSGTTGPPKGVMLTHRNLYLHTLSAMASYPIHETDIFLHLIPLFHVNGWGTPPYLTAKGGTHVMLKRFDPAKALELVQKEKVTTFFIIPGISYQ